MKAPEKSLEVVPNGDGTAFFIVVRGRGSRTTIRLSRKASKRLAFIINESLRATKQTPMFEQEISDATIREEESAIRRGNGLGGGESEPMSDSE